MSEPCTAENHDSMHENLSQANDLKNKFIVLQRAFNREPYSSFAVRKARLQALKSQLGRYQQLLADAMSDDFGHRSHTESVLADVLAPILDINHVLSHLKRWIKPKRRPTEWLFKGNKLQLRYQPKGVVGIICPWNFPLYLSIGPMITALAAGNRCMIKMPPNCPRTTTVLKRMLAEIYSEDLVCIIEGEHPQAMEISHLPFDHLIFTGSPASGKHIMANAAANLTPVTLELGGKSPAVVFDDFDIEKAAERIAHGKGLNSGQICIAPDYAMVPKDKIDRFVTALQAANRKMYPSFDGNRDVTHLVDEAQEARFIALVKDAEEKGAVITRCGEKGKARQYPLHIVTSLSPDMRICQEEIFGPLLPVYSYDDIKDVVEHIQSRARPLACYLFSHNAEQREWVLTNTHSGGVTINDWGWHVLNHSVPFGGTGHSGIGNYHGEEGFHELSHARTVLEMKPWFPIQIFSPPYGTLLQRLTLRLFVGKADPNLKEKN